MICRTAKTAPQQLRLPFTTWSLATLADYLGRYYRLTISAETVRTILRDAEITWQATKTWKHQTWKHSRDPDFAAKKTRILALHDQAADMTRPPTVRSPRAAG